MKDKKGEKQVGKQIGKRRKEKTIRFFVKRQQNFVLKRQQDFVLKRQQDFVLKRQQDFVKKTAEFCFEEETFCAGSFALVLKTIETILNLICRCNDNLDQGC